MIFAENMALYEGQPIGAILATHESIAKKAAELVKIEYDKEEVVVSINDAIKADSFFPVPAHLPFKVGEPENAFSSSDHVIEGEFETPR